MKILLSGGSGFIGKNLLKYITQNISYNILLVGRNLEKIENKNIKQVKLDLNKIEDDFDKIKEFNPDIFLHLAWEGIPNYSEELSKKNYLNTIKIMKMIANETTCKKIVSTGSCWEYNDGGYIGECKEDQLISLNKPFSKYKNKIYNEIYNVCEKKKILFNWLRLFYVYGPGQGKNSIIPLLIDIFKNNKKININFPSNKNDFIFIDDVVSILDKFIINNYSSGIYNVGTGKSTSISTILKLIDNAVNGNDMISKKYLNDVDLKKSNQNFFASTKKLKKNLNSIDFTQIESGIKKMINYI